MSYVCRLCCVASHQARSTAEPMLLIELYGVSPPAQANLLLETSCHLRGMMRSAGYRRHEEDSGHDLAQHDRRNVCLQRPVHAVCMDGAAAQLPASCVPRLQRERSALPNEPLVQLVQFWAACGAAGNACSSSSARGTCQVRLLRCKQPC